MRHILFLLSFVFVLTASAQAPRTLRVTGDASSNKLQVSLAGLRTDGSSEANTFLQVLKADLNRSGWLEVSASPNALLRVNGMANGGGGVAASLSIVAANGATTPWSRRASASDVRMAAHNASDEIVYRLTGNKGMASAPILLVGKRAGKTNVYYCDADGANLRGVTGDGALCWSPTWLPDRSGFLYTACVKTYPAIYRADFLPQGGVRRTPVANFSGLNTGGVVSPDGRLAAMVLSFSGNVELYVMNLSAKKLTRLTKTPHANEASPDWSPDGRTIAYVSDESGRPNVYLLAQGAPKGRRLVHGLQESVAPDWSPDGTKIAFCGKSGGVYGIYVCDTNGRHAKISPDGASYQDPSWAPDGRHIIASKGPDGNRTLVLLDSMGDNPVNLTPYPGDWYLPDWSK